MRTVQPVVRVWLAAGAAKLRPQADGLLKRVREQFRPSPLPLSGRFFVLPNRHRGRLKTPAEDPIQPLVLVAHGLLDVRSRSHPQTGIPCDRGDCSSTLHSRMAAVICTTERLGPPDRGVGSRDVARPIVRPRSNAFRTTCGSAASFVLCIVGIVANVAASIPTVSPGNSFAASNRSWLYPKTA